MSNLFDKAYITVEDIQSTGDLPIALEEVLNNIDTYIAVEVKENYEEYFVLLIEYEDWHDVLDIASIISSILLQKGITSFSFTYKDSQSIYE
jgi:hypothetical protein